MPGQTQINRDTEGYVVDPDDWSEDVATQFAIEEGITINDKYWSVIHFMRQYWTEHHVAPDVRHVVQFLVQDQGIGKKEAKQYLFNLFPYGYVKQACKIAGMQRPRVWSTG